MRLTHQALLTPDVAVLVEFYTGWCGMRLVKDRREPTARVIWLAAPQRDDFVFVLIEDGAAAVRTQLADGDLGVHMGFQLESRAAVDDLYRRMAQAGLRPDPPEDHGGVVGYIFFVRDPDGRNVEFNAGQDVGPANWDPMVDPP